MEPHSLTTEPSEPSGPAISTGHSQDSIPQMEMETMAFWKQHCIYEKSLAQRANSPRFVFYEGPPTANGLPHPGHCLTRAIKDLYPRYKTMRGFLCERKAGWDTHGLPVEVEVCKELGIHSKDDIEQYGVEPFIHKCLESVFRYTQQWEYLTQRLGFWIDLDTAYVTYHRSYIESVWWILKSLFDRGLLYQGHKIVWWWAQGGTALSSGEVGQGYRQVADPSVYVRFPLEISTESADLLVWTTTPWTLPSNQFAAVNPNLEYVIVSFTKEDGTAAAGTVTAGTAEGRDLIVAAALLETLAGKLKRKPTVKRSLFGRELIGLRYTPPFECYHQHSTTGWYVVGADFVTTDSGTGIVHIAPAFGEDDFEVLKKEQARFESSCTDTSGTAAPELICAVGPDGKFTQVCPEFAGRWVKDSDKDICKFLKDRGLLVLHEQYVHDYPFCWRADNDPLIQYPRKSWFVKTTQFRDSMLANNETIHWLPEHIKNGRFGNFLEANVDWALSRERYWGTPLPIWVCKKTGQMEAISSYSELLAKPGVSGTEVWTAAKAATPSLSDDLAVHKPYIDAVTYDSPFADGSRMKRVTEVIDCWFDSGAMPFAQWGYPNVPGSHEKLAENFPADFISEAIDQTRGWFYSLLAIATLSETLSRSPFRNCIVLGLMLGEDGQKMSKSKRNYREPNEIFDKYGADSLRWYFFANQTPWTSIRYSEQAIKDSMPEFLLRLTNVVSFYDVYRNIDGIDPACWDETMVLPVSQRSELDRWILSELHTTIKTVCEAMDGYDHFTAAAKLTSFVDSLSNWYVRRSRDRFWSSVTVEVADTLRLKHDAYVTLYECLVTTAKLIAPFTPFLAERMWQTLEKGKISPESIHLCDYPVCDESKVDTVLSKRMQLIRNIVSLGRNARVHAKLKVRQPLAGIEVILADRSEMEWLNKQVELIAEELNVKNVEFTEQADHYISYSVVPDFKKLGPKLGKLLPAVKAALSKADGGVLLAEMEKNGHITLTISVSSDTTSSEAVTLLPEDVQIRLQAKDGWAASQGDGCVVVLATTLTAELLAEGRAREIIRKIQDRRKEMGCEYTDRITVTLATADTEDRLAAEQFRDYICGETLCNSLEICAAVAAEEIVVEKLQKFL